MRARAETAVITAGAIAAALANTSWYSPRRIAASSCAVGTSSDFDGATFTHSGAMVTFETLLASFELRTPALSRLGVLVHGLDAGGVLPPEAAGVERVLAGMRDAITDDDQLLLAAAGVFEGLLVAFDKETAT